MSYGIVVCSTCQREVHQDGERDVRNGWRHCEDKSPICVGAHAAYPEFESDIKGKWCGRDRGPSEEYRAIVDHGNHQSRKMLTTELVAAAAMLSTCAMPTPHGARPTPRARPGNKYMLCPCGSREVWAKCCGAR